jgi:hypothetical protein
LLSPGFSNRKGKHIMKLIVAGALIALALTTGFTCSKNTPPAEQQPATTPAPEATAAPTEGQPAAPTEGQPAAPTEGQPAAPTEGQPAAPAENH